MTSVLVVSFRYGQDADANRDRVTAIVGSVGGQAREGGPVDLVVFPEYASRYYPRGVGPEHAEPLDGPFVTGLRAAARAAGVAVIAGTTIPGDRPDRAVNAVVMVDREGALGVYRKVHLYDAFGQRESDRLEAGPADGPPPVIVVGGLRVGVMTCYDLRFPESARRLVDAGADVLAVPAAWVAGEHKADHWLTLLRARAIENTAYVLGAALDGPGLTGESIVVDPYGVVVAGAGAGGAGPGAGGLAGEGDRWVTAVLDASVVAQARERNPSLYNRRYVVVPAERQGGRAPASPPRTWRGSPPRSGR